MKIHFQNHRRFVLAQAITYTFELRNHEKENKTRQQQKRGDTIKQQQQQ